MASAAAQSLKKSLGNAISTATTAVEGTTAIANAAVGQASKITQTAVGAAGVIGVGAVKASEAIGAAALDATSRVGTTGLAQGADVTAKTLEASVKITNAATSAAADIASTALDTTAQTTNVTTEKVGEALQSGITLAGNTVSRVANGIDNVGSIVAGRGSLIVKGTLQRQGAESQAIDARAPAVLKQELLRAFSDIEKLITSAFSTLSGVQKTALVGKTNVYKKAKCGAFKRMTGTCVVGPEISNDMKKTDFFLDEFKSSIKKASEESKAAILTASGDVLSAFQAIQETYLGAVDATVKKFVASYAELSGKYDKLAKEALGIQGGRRRRRTYRKKKVIRVSRKRPSGRGYSS
jgi:hypothetical protein